MNRNAGNDPGARALSAGALRRLFGVCLLAAAIAAPAGRAAAQAVQAQTIQGPELEAFLRNARVTALERLGEGVTGSEKATLELDGVVRDAVFKTIDEYRPGPTRMADGTIVSDFQDSWMTEVAAYELDKLIGMGRVPATVERTLDGRVGSLQLWVEAEMSESDRQRNGVRPPDSLQWAQEAARLSLFDNLIYNVDRHLNNLLLTKDFEMRLIDHSRSFAGVGEIRMPESLTRFSKSIVERMQQLTEASLRERLGRYLRAEQIRGVLERRDLILARVAESVREKGEAGTFFP